MTRSLLRREFESGDGRLLRYLRIAVPASGVCFLLSTGLLKFTWPQQMLFGLSTVLIASYLNRNSSSYLITLALVLISMFSTFRYGYRSTAPTIASVSVSPGTGGDFVAFKCAWCKVHSSESVAYGKMKATGGNAVYQVNSLSLWVRISLLFFEFPWLALISVITFCVLMATSIRTMLDRRARVRLQRTGNHPLGNGVYL